MIGLGIYALFGAKGNAFDPLLNDKNFVYPILAIGILLEIFVSINLWPLFKLNSKYNNE